jgi:hypothetical protein
MNIYETLIKLKENNLLKVCIHNGLISYIYLDYLKIFEEYKDLKKQGFNKMDCYFQLSDKYSVSETTIRKIIKLLQPFDCNK